jgi:hypothetical protein
MRTMKKKNNQNHYRIHVIGVVLTYGNQCNECDGNDEFVHFELVTSYTKLDETKRKTDNEFEQCLGFYRSLFMYFCKYLLKKNLSMPPIAQTYRILINVLNVNCDLQLASERGVTKKKA